MSLTRIGSIGINTGIAFAGVTTIVTLNTANDALSIGATVNVGSGITLGASGDIFATGVSTVTTLKVGSGVTVSSDGDVFFTGIATGNGSGLTALNATQLTSGTVPTARLGSGTASSSTFLRGDSTFQTVNTDLVSDTSPQLGGNLESNGNDIDFADSDKAVFGTGSDLRIFHNGSDSVLQDTGTGNLLFISNQVQIKNAANNETLAKFIEDGAVELYYDNSKKLETHASNGVQFPSGLQSPDTQALRLGTSNDLLLYHDGSNSFITNASSGGYLHIRSGSGINLQDDTGDENFIKCIDNGAVEIYHNNTKRLETQSGGVRIRDRLGVNCDPNSSHPMQVDHDEQYIIAIRNTAADSSNFPWLCHKEINSTQAFAIHINGLSGDPFHVDQNGGIFLNKETATANRLADYEEGSFTPTSNATIGTVNGQYTKIGRQITVHIRMAISSQSNSATFKIESLPFAANMNSGLSNGSQPGGFGYISGSAFSNGEPQIHMRYNNSYVEFYDFGTALSINVFAGREIRLGFIYYAN